MSRVGIVALLVATAVAPASASSRPPLLTVSSTRPLQVRGTHFVSGERVRVVVSLPARASRTVVATASGMFTVRFRRIYLGRCEAIAVRARGNQGSSASLRIAPMCVPAQTIARYGVRIPYAPLTLRAMSG